MRHTKMLYAEIENRLLPATCLMSSVFGAQQLRSGEEAFCDNGWTVITKLYGCKIG